MSSARASHKVVCFEYLWVASSRVEFVEYLGICLMRKPLWALPPPATFLPYRTGTRLLWRWPPARERKLSAPSSAVLLPPKGGLLSTWVLVRSFWHAPTFRNFPSSGLRHQWLHGRRVEPPTVKIGSQVTDEARHEGKRSRIGSKFSAAYHRSLEELLRGLLELVNLVSGDGHSDRLRAPIQLMSLPPTAFWSLTGKPAAAVHRRMFVSCSTASSRSPLNTKAGSSTKICVEALGSIADSVRHSHAAKRPRTVGLLAAPNTRVSKTMTCSSSCGLRFGFAAVKPVLARRYVQEVGVLDVDRGHPARLVVSVTFQCTGSQVQESRHYV